MSFQVTFFIFSVLFAGSCHAGRDESCEQLSTLIESKVANSSSSNVDLSGSGRSICSTRPSCCSLEMEEKLNIINLVELDDAVDRHDAELRGAFTKMHTKFDEYFLQLIDKASASLDQLFYRTYGDLYAENSALFVELFRDLKAYYRGRSSVDVQDRFETFFTGVLQKVFELMHPKRLFTDDYLQCIADDMSIIQPFALMPETISSQIERSFANAQHFVSGLEVAKNIKGGKTAESSLGSSCQVAMMKMSGCPLCYGLVNKRPCYGLCVNVMNGCLVEHHHMHQSWKNYIDALRYHVYRLEGPYNIEAVLGSIDVKISEAIMMLQENADDITATIFKNCGAPEMNPNVTSQSPKSMDIPAELRLDDLNEKQNPLKRQSDVLGDDDDVIATHGVRTKRSTKRKDRGARKGRKHRHAKRRGRHLERRRIEKKTKQVNIIDERRYRDFSGQEPSIAAQLSEVKQVLNDYEKHWISLPQQLCRDKGEESDTCWNGEDSGSYQPHLVGDGIKQQRNNPEVNIAGHVVSPPTRKQMAELKKAVDQLKRVYNGEDSFRGSVVDDDDGLGYSGAGSAEGSLEKRTGIHHQTNTTILTAEIGDPQSDEDGDHKDEVPTPIPCHKDSRCNAAPAIISSSTFMSFISLVIALLVTTS